jgi:peptide/nickel transport system substrate-binding protein
MFHNKLQARTTRIAAAAAAALLAVGLAACSGSGSAGGPSASASASPAGPAVRGAAARMALPPGATLSYIWPFTPRGSASQYNAEQFQELMYRPLYVFGDNGPSVSVNYQLSVAHAPVYSNGGKTVTITMKGWKWSDGEPVDASDVVFWLNLMKAEPGRYYGYVPGLLPDNLVSYRAAGPDTVVLNLNSPVSSIWFTYNQLAEITPMPAAWDIASAGAAPGTGGCAADTAADNWSKCAAVYRFLSAQAENARGYAANPLWGVVDGPWKLSGFAPAPLSAGASGPVASFVPNTAYSGSPKPRLAGLAFYAYRDGASEYQALRAGRLDVGYVPTADLPPVTGGQLLPASSPLGGSYALAPAYQFGIDYLQVNYGNPTAGPAFKQLYLRQALQELVDQEGMIAAVAHGYGYPTSGGVPSQPLNQWAAVNQSVNGGQGPYPFSVANAASLLGAHGWTLAGGVLTCSAPAKCGAGVAAGTKLSLTLDYPAGAAYAQQEAAILKSDFAQAGVRLRLVAQSPDTIGGESASCKPAQPRCDWDILMSGWNFTGPRFEPTGEPLFATGGSSNAGSYSNPEEDMLISKTRTSDSLLVFQDYAQYTANNLPSVWMPDFYTVQATSARLANVAFSPIATLLPEYWYFTR